MTNVQDKNLCLGYRQLLDISFVLFDVSCLFLGQTESLEYEEEKCIWCSNQSSKDGRSLCSKEKLSNLPSTYQLNHSEETLAFEATLASYLSVLSVREGPKR